MYIAGGLDPVLLWLWLGLAAVAPVGPLAWELPYAMGVALKKKKKPIPNYCRPSVHRIFTKMGHILGYKARLNKCPQNSINQL